MSTFVLGTLASLIAGLATARTATYEVIIGFVIMMLFDVLLG